jgi:hypothetical protein
MSSERGLQRVVAVKGNTVDKGERSLRLLVQKWLALASAKPARVTRGNCSGREGGRYVSVEVHRPSGPLVILFFQAPDGTWSVVPPQPQYQCLKAA